MLIIYGALPLGGIETFFLRLCKQRASDNIKTKILLLSNKNESNPSILDELEKYAEVYFITDIFCVLNFFAKKAYLIAPLRIGSLLNILSDIDHIHVTHGAHALLAYRFSELLKKKFLITVGIYHSKEFSWKCSGNLPYYERKNRDFLFRILPRSNLYTFSDSIVSLYRTNLGVDLSEAKTFRIGVIERNKTNTLKFKLSNSKIMICSVGRLVDFKTYNLWMLDVVRSLLDNGYSVEYHIFGSGPLLNDLNFKIKEMKLDENVILKGDLDYNFFDQTVASYDLFVGSGTSIIQASSLGTPSIIAIESSVEPLTYGYFCDFSNIDYNFEQPYLVKVSVENLIKIYIDMNQEQRNNLSLKHINSVEIFYMDTCSLHFDDVDSLSFFDSFEFNSLIYTLSYNLHKFILKINSKSIYHS